MNFLQNREGIRQGVASYYFLNCVKTFFDRVFLNFEVQLLLSLYLVLPAELLDEHSLSEVLMKFVSEFFLHVGEHSTFSWLVVIAKLGLVVRNYVSCAVLVNVLGWSKDVVT